MIFRQVTHDDLGCASYLIGDEHEGVAAVVDPRFEIDEYLALARYLGVRIEHVLETHNHADHVSGHGRLAAATGATIHIHRIGAPDYEHEPFDDGWELVTEWDSDVQIVDVRERVEWTAGHIPGSVHAPYHDLRVMPDGIDLARPVAAICASGQRSSLGASLLQRHGGEHVIHVIDGGVGTWERLGRPIERGD